MYEIRILVMGGYEKSYYPKNKKEAKKIFEQFKDNLNCYPQLVVNGREKTLAQAYEHFGLNENFRRLTQTVRIYGF